MIGAIVYELRALNTDSLPLYHGQQMHGLCFKILKDYSPVMADYIHNQMLIKPFTAAELAFYGKISATNNRLYIKEGQLLRWRVTALSDEVLQAFLSLQPGYKIYLGNLQLDVERVYADPELCEYSGVVEPTEMMAECFSCALPSSITMDFQSATTFRSGKNDFPWPLPEYVFGSLADKWAALRMPGDISRTLVAEAASAILPLSWQGKSCWIKLSPQRSARCFVGRFTYGVNNLSDTYKGILAVLAAYAEFAGVGRWTSHGLGQVRIIDKN
ncbi:CRISPR system precrRNA processing endoribonuclease RAMP protein Cas6 [Selenomonas ruminantium]|uniref:CRISPR-associated endoribonuclease Cas6 n=1 Tax=Selenomonas ruminantium TaxID=971 RepID=A0A1H0NJN2_SELRU|nr:CRISPR system precrRNA processing endoribonuclease RAMP protein Cas6 [Selenomonas ruminantium]SDO92883.1 CRISPR-associated endoribonuclease Cas6 [Selenomonas ruminantium]